MAVVLVATLFVLLLGRVWALDFNEEWAEFEEWQRENGRQYTSEDEMKKRFSVFEENKKTISHLNNLYRERGMKFTVNQFADLTPEEFHSTVLMRPLPVGDAKRTNYKIRSSQPLPTSFDWREKNVVSSVKDQGTVGSCWAFSTVGNIEGQWALKTKSLLSLSPELLVDCDDSKDPQHNHADCGVFGGWPYLAYDFIKELGGIETESDYPYCSGTGDCYPCPPSDYNKTLCGPPPSYCNKTQSCPDKLNRTKFVPGLKVQSWMPIEKNETAMMYELVQRGPLSVLIDAGLLQFYHSGVWDPLVGCGKDYLDHAVLLVGYGVQKELLSHKPYWLIKNSWGKKWGMDGYFKMIRGKGKCGIDLQVTTAILD